LDETAKTQTTKYNFSYGRIGGTDPFDGLTDQQLAKMTQVLDQSAAAYQQYTGNEVTFFTGKMSWISSNPADLANPRGVYYPQVTPPTGPPPYVPQNMTYCGGPTDGGPWAGCDPQRFNVDGAVERMLANDIDRLVVIDTTTTGVRFFKTFEQLAEARKVVAAYNASHGTNITVEWVNDPNDLMLASYPTSPANWTYSLGAPAADASIALAGNPNPVTDSPALALVIAPGVEAAFRQDVKLKDTGIVLMNHATRAHAQWYDPKIDDTLKLNQNLRSVLTWRNNKLKADNILGAWFGRQEFNPYANKNERTRAMRGENLGEAYLYETNEELPTGQDGYLYWDALEELKNRGMKHIVIVFPQIITDSVLNLVEVPNQVAKEIGYKNYVGWNNLDFVTYPGVGHPFTGIWGNWATTMCRLPGSSDESVKEPCCFTMGGCPGSAQPYPPERQTLLTAAMKATDPSLVYQVSDYGHLGYDPALGAPNPNAPVQAQYTGTWDMYRPASASPLVGGYLAAKVWQHILTNP
ncbi:MAG: hypothetical protein HUU35_19105, partial [Armatimonadetes bacterium]|nr:hypothetical protein [Armatimonadota bacterium]